MPFRKLSGVGTSTATLAESKSMHIVLTEEWALRFSTEHDTNNGINRLIIIFAIVVFFIIIFKACQNFANDVTIKYQYHT